MTTFDITGTIVSGVTLTPNVYSNPVTIDAGASVSGNRGVYAEYGWSVTNLGVITGVAGPAVVFYGGGGITNSAGAQMVGANFGVAAYGATTVTNAGTITGGVIGIRFLDSSGSSNNTIVNSGTIIGNDGPAVQFGAGNDLLDLLPGFAFAGAVDGGAGTNRLELGGTAAGTIGGLGSVYTNFGTVTVDAGADWTLTGVNSLMGVILTGNGTLTNAGTINNYGNPVFGAGSLINKGTISNGYGTGVVLDPGGSLDNQGANAQVAAYSTAVYAHTGTVTNSGTIASTTGNSDNNSAFGVHFVAGGVVTNTGAAAKISGQTGVIIEGGAGTIGNAGTIAGSSLAVRLQNGGTISNTGTIQGATGIVLAAGGSVTNAAGAVIAANSFAVLAYDSTTVINSGTIVGYNGMAIQFGGGDDLLKLKAGAVITGGVDGGAGTNVLELASGGAGSIAGLGTAFANFGAVKVDAGAHWTLTGANTLAAGATLTNGGTLTNTGTLTNAGIISVKGALVNSGTLINSGNITGGTTRIGSGGNEIIAARGFANDIIVSSGGVLNIQSGGAAAGINVLRGGTIVYGGGSGIFVNVSSGGREIVAAGAKLFAPTVRKGAILTVSSGGTASNVVLSGGTAIVKAGGTIAGAVTFGTQATLSVETKPTSKTLTISGFKATDTLDLTKFGFNTTDKLSFVPNAAKTSGVLTVSSGSLHASVTLFGQFIAGGFHLTSDGAAGTAITYSTSAAVHLNLAGHHD